MSFDTKAIGARIKQIRCDRGITAVKAAAELNISLGYYRKIEAGERGISVCNIVLISDFLGVTTDYLIKGTPVNQEIADELGKVIDKLSGLEIQLRNRQLPL